ncbi:hypothetical protein NQ176_g8066 [Zarea fungicola]|uniref:Uncharacterized protein n=1 Tax=Zarea fungicola TaxID=93591 RepID=A0ACC1MWR7_9HYPO|nr:hypothetical protein NQ176_g8066 [Lecanicillium fungicola]
MQEPRGISDSLSNGSKKSIPNGRFMGLDFHLVAIFLQMILGREIYLRKLGSELQNWLSRHAREMQTHTNISPEDIKQVKYVKDFDRLVHVPFVAIHALDDPIAIKEAIPYAEFRKNPNTVLVLTTQGGHLGWFERNGRRWYNKPVREIIL